jgi:hypothetical protein
LETNPRKQNEEKVETLLGHNRKKAGGCESCWKITEVV